MTLPNMAGWMYHFIVEFIKFLTGGNNGDNFNQLTKQPKQQLRKLC